MERAMTWDIALQSFTAVLAGIGGWFLYDLVSEFKTFKKETHTDIISLKKERDDFKSTVRNAELSIGLRVNEMQTLHTDFRLAVNDALQKINLDLDQINSKTKNLDKVLANTVTLLRHYDKELKTVKVKLDNITIFKTGK